MRGLKGNMWRKWRRETSKHQGSLVETVGIGVGWGPRSPRADLWSNTRTYTEVSIPFLALPQGAELGTGLASPPRFHMRQAVGRMPLTDCLHQVDQVCHEQQISGRGCGLISQFLREGSA